MSTSGGRYVPCDPDGDGTGFAGEVVRSDGDDPAALIAERVGYPLPHAPPEGDNWIFRVCVTEGGTVFLDSPPYLEVGQSADVRPNQNAALAAAIATIELHAPVLRTAPPTDADQLVAVPVWIATDAASADPITAEATDGPVTVSITATPTALTFDPGDGTELLRCTPVPDEPTEACAHSYNRSSADQPDGSYLTTLELHYRVDWTSSIGLSGSIDGGATTTSTTPLTVSQVQALID